MVILRPIQAQKVKTLSCCHWNVNSILAHDKHLLTAHNSTQHYNIIFISETYLDSSTDLSGL